MADAEMAAEPDEAAEEVAPAVEAAEPEPEPPALVPGEISLQQPRTTVRGRTVAPSAAALALSPVVLRRYFFATPATARLGSLHFDVLLDPADKIDHSTDHLRYRYVDFLTLPGAQSVLDLDSNSADIEDIRSWLDGARPQTRIEAYPLFVVAKELLHHLLQGGVTFNNRLADQLRAELEAAEAKMVELREMYGADEAVLDAAIAALSEAIATLEAELTELKETSKAELAEINAALQAARQEFADAQAAKADLQQQVEGLADELLKSEQKIANALGDCYSLEMMAEKLCEMMANGTLKSVLEMLEPEDKMALFCQLLQTFDIDEKHQAMKEVFSAFLAGELDLKVVMGNMRDPEKEEILQILLKEFAYSPQAVLKQLGGGADATLSDAETAALEKAATGIIKQALHKACPQKPLVDALGIDRMALIRALLEELGLEKFLEQMGIDKAAVIANFGLVDPDENQPPQPIVTPTAPHATQFPDPNDVALEAVAAKRKAAVAVSKTLRMVRDIPAPPHLDAPAPMAETALVKLCDQIYEDKVKADEVDDREGNKREPLPEFIYDHLVNQYGLKSLAKEHLGQLINGVRKHCKKGTPEFLPRVYMFGQLAGIVNESMYSNINANFMMDFLRRLYVSDMIAESLNHPQCAVTLDQALEAIRDNWQEYSTEVPPGLIAEVTGFGADATVEATGGGTKVIVQVLVDELWAVVYANWLVCAAEQDRRLVDVFNRFDNDHDGSLSLNEFKKLVNAVDNGTTGELTADQVPLRDDRQIVRMYKHAVEVAICIKIDEFCIQK